MPSLICLKSCTSCCHLSVDDQIFVFDSKYEIFYEPVRMWLNAQSCKAVAILAVCAVPRNLEKCIKFVAKRVQKTAKILELLCPVLFLQMLAIRCEKCQGEHPRPCQQKLSELGQDLERWLRMSHRLFDRHPSPDLETTEGQRALQELDQVLSELVKQLDGQVSGEDGKSRRSTYR